MVSPLWEQAKSCQRQGPCLLRTVSESRPTPKNAKDPCAAENAAHGSVLHISVHYPLFSARSGAISSLLLGKQISAHLLRSI